MAKFVLLAAVALFVLCIVTVDARIISKHATTTEYTPVRFALKQNNVEELEVSHQPHDHDGGMRHTR